MVAYITGSNPIENGDLGSNVKVTVTENVCKTFWRIRRVHIRHKERNKKKHSENANISTFMTLKGRKESSLNDIFRNESYDSWLIHIHNSFLCSSV